MSGALFITEARSANFHVPPNLCEVAALAVDVVLRLVVLEGLSADRETRPLDDLVVLWAGAGVDDVLEGHGHLGAPTVRQGPGGMDQLRHLVQTHLLCPLPEDEQKGVDGVGLAAAVRADDGGETFVEGADDLRDGKSLGEDRPVLIDLPLNLLPVQGSFHNLPSAFCTQPH